MPRKPCIEPTCGRLHSNKGPRCTTCSSAQDRARDQKRGNTTERGYGWNHQQARETLLADNPLCAYCKVRPATHADHVEPLSRTRQHTDTPEYAPACDHCNLSKGNNDQPKTFPQAKGGRHVSAGQRPKP